MIDYVPFILARCVIPFSATEEQFMHIASKLFDNKGWQADIKNVPGAMTIDDFVSRWKPYVESKYFSKLNQ